jgi:HEAT repeat protein
MSAPTRYCPVCYALNVSERDRCVSCGAVLETDESYDERLIWALDHPDSSVAMLASSVLAARHADQAIERLIATVNSPDPYRAAAAARALTAFGDNERAQKAVAALREHPSALVRRAVSDSRHGQPELSDLGEHRC